jgi:hypothetical protein
MKIQSPKRTGGGALCDQPQHGVRNLGANERATNLENGIHHVDVPAGSETREKGRRGAETAQR